MKQFFKMMFASALGAMVATGVLLFILISIAFGIVASVGDTPDYTPSSNTVFKIKLDGTMQDNPSNPLTILWGEEESTFSLKDLLEAIRLAKQEDKIVGIYLESGSLSTGSATREAIRRALADFKESGKFIIAYADSYTQGNYYLCSVADKIFLNPQGMLQLSGLSSQSMFYKGFLKKIGVEVQVFKVGTYKGAVEPYMLDKLSNANREQIQSYVSSIWNHLSEGIAQSRHISVESVNQFANEGLLYADPAKAVEYGFVDELTYQTEAEKYVKELAGQSDKKLRSANVAQINTLRKSSAKNQPKIAILYAEGEIQSQGSSSIYEVEQGITEKMTDELIKLKNDDEVKAVVLRVNSPGGSSFLSDQIWHQVVALREVKPIVVSMGDMAASGGYYISCAANKIIAEPNTLTGSIGVFGMFPNIAGLLGKLDLTTDLVKTNAFSDMGDASRPMTESEKALLQGYVERTYQIFLSRCADGRGMTTEEIDAIGQGRVWTGEQAKEIGLVDELGGIETAISQAAELAELDRYEVTTANAAKSFLDDWLESQWGEAKLSIAKRILGDEFESFQTLRRLQASRGILMRLPYDMKPL